MSQINRSRQRVLVYLDSTTFGGHEVTLLEAVRELALAPDIALLLLVPRSNQRLLSQLRLLEGSFEIVEHSFQTAPGDVFRAILGTAKVRLLQQAMLKLKPDLVIVSQGAIGLSACGLGAARRAGIPLISFLPMAHPVSVIRGGNSVSVRLQELLYKRLYAMPDCFLTICRTAKEQLQHVHGVDPARIFVQYFGIDLDRSLLPQLPRQRAPRQERRIALIGRIEFQQKRHDFFMRHLAAARSALPPLVVHVIGDGPDQDRLRRLVEELGLQDAIRFEGWTESMNSWYEQLDAVLLPSRFEGVPVVMLEAMLWGVPVVASKLDGMAELLPEEWLFPVDEGQTMIQRLQEVLVCNSDEQVARNRQLAENLTADSFRKGFCKAVRSCLEDRSGRGAS